jgi:hypothetical protein
MRDWGCSEPRMPVTGGQGSAACWQPQARGGRWGGKTSLARLTTSADGRAPQPRLRAEEAKLRGTWAGYRKDMLGRYLVSGYQDPRINVQSILAKTRFRSPRPPLS